MGSGRLTDRVHVGRRAAGGGGARQLAAASDIYTVRPDGSDLRRLTTDTAGPIGTTEPVEYGAGFPTWTRDGRIVFSRNVELDERVWQVWVMDRDGSNPTQIDPSDVAAFTAIGCVVCPYPPADPLGRPAPAYWVPAE